MSNTLSSPAITLVVGADDNYAMPLSVTLYSGLINLKSECPVELYVLDGGIREANKKRLERVVQKSESSVHLRWVKVDISSIADLPTHEWINTTTYLRLFISEIVPENVTKALYLDSDLLIERSLTELWDHNLDSYPLAATQAYGTPTVSFPLGISSYEELGYPPDTPYFNAGVLLCNLERWRKEDLSGQVIAYLRKYRDQVQMNDQEGLNAVLAQDWKPLDLKWNVMSHLVNFDEWPGSPFKEKVRPRREELLTDAYIYHFAGGSKPWQIGCTHPAQLQWISYLWESGWFTPTERVRWFGEWFARYYWWQVKKRLGVI